METLSYFYTLLFFEMVKKFEVVFLEEVNIFLNNIDDKAKLKIIYNIENAQVKNDPRLFKKLTSSIWELEQSMGISNIDCSLFGIKPMVKKH